MLRGFALGVPLAVTVRQRVRGQIPHERPKCPVVDLPPGVTDLDLAVYDPDGHIAGGDVSRDRWPVVPPRGPLCVEQEGVYTLAVSVARGRGDYVLEIWGTE